MEFRQLQHFLAVVESCSFHKAGDVSIITPQAISRSIQQLEKGMWRTPARAQKGHPSQRRAHRIRPDVLPRAERALAELRMFRDEIENATGTGREMGELGATPTVARSLLPAAIR